MLHILRVIRQQGLKAGMVAYPKSAYSLGRIAQSAARLLLLDPRQTDQERVLQRGVTPLLVTPRRSCMSCLHVGAKQQ